MEADMKVIRVGRSCLLAFLVFGAITAASASAAEYETRALPEWGRCVQVETGKGAYKGKTCVVKETGKVGKWEWMPATATEKIAFEGSGTPVVLKTAGHETVSCV